MNINDCIDQVVIFNEIAGNLDNITHESLIAQSKVVAEEGNELLEAVEEGNVNEILKEAVDVLVTIHGFVKMLEAQGYDVIGAFNEVNINNLSKFSKTELEAAATVFGLEQKEVDSRAYFNGDYGVWVVKNDSGKVMKPFNYEKCSVASYTPKGILPKVKLDEVGGDLC